MLTLAVIGVGFIGSTLVRTLLDNPDIIEQHNVKLVAVASRQERKKSQFPNHIKFYTVYEDLLRQEHLDIVVELVGGNGEAPFSIITKSLQQGINVVTANKDLMAIKGQELMCLATSKNLALKFESAAGAGLTWFSAINEIKKSNKIHRISGLFNGTTNFILSEMAAGKSYEDSLREAQAKGFAETDPTNDVSGKDAAYKLVLLAASSFGKFIDISDVQLTSIELVDQDAIALAARQGKVIKHIAHAECQSGKVFASVKPVMVDQDSEFGITRGANSKLFIEGDLLSQYISGPGAGGNTTVSGIIADVISIAHGDKSLTF